ncbi:High-affinity branched-chain amino acid transport ATP-binding protein LivF [Methylobacterium crusticola]|uniref:High-affinity branched-chain amino acid transport ATP-binding protein LivF n=1 Tax=Methylobacterium crusticola TaxID=1697972 RepID=A0ABQ4R694_9HYPH|nr:ABC transporter ATP-binding protein [Methylobacterium crusticola]GJD53235.1 High-affinity branched-chain amino acid transport ATP-binding protein LivF [Methylobacterium crusticola]
MAGAMLEVRGADVFYGASQILFGVDLAVEKGQTMALLGRNGAGKSTTFKAIAGLAPPRRGRVILSGETVSGRPPYRIARAGIGYVPEDRQVFPEHTVEDNLLVGAKRGPRGEAHWTLARVYEVLPLLAGLRTRMAGRLSGGEQQMLTIARTLMGNPDILLLDEPSEGLAPLVVQAIGALIRTLRGMGVTILLAEQNMHFCLAIATHATVVDKGEVVYRGTIPELRANAAVTQRYLAV